MVRGKENGDFNSDETVQNDSKRVISADASQRGAVYGRLTVIVVIVAVAVAVISFGVIALLLNIFEKKQEAKNPFFRVVEIDDNTVDPAIWGKNFPYQYDQYLRTTDQKRTRYGGSEAFPKPPSEGDPRSAVSKSVLEEVPDLKTMWAGYAFAVDFREDRGHAYMLEDQTYTERQKVVKQPGTCLNCHASTYTTYKKLGNGDIVKGFEAMNKMPYTEARKLVQHPVACIDCHDPDTMQLRVTRPAFMEGIRTLKATQGITDYDVNKMATRQEMRSYVCGQCHVEYYFKGPEKRLVYPWMNGQKGDQILAYYEEEGFKDWSHAITGAPTLKAQHPEFEMWSQGIHARSGVACADCHMPFERVGAFKISNHHVQSPLLNINNACQTCHKFSEEEMRARVETIQGRTLEMRNLALAGLMDLISAIENGQKSGMAADRLDAARQSQRKAQFLLDFVFSENSLGFHAPQEAARLLTHSLDYSYRGQMALAGIAAAKRPEEVDVESPQGEEAGGEEAAPSVEPKASPATPASQPQ